MSEYAVAAAPEFSSFAQEAILPSRATPELAGDAGQQERDAPTNTLVLPETFASLQETARKRELARYAFHRDEEMRENSPHEDNGGGLRSYHKRLMQPQERSIDTLLRTHHTLAGDDIRRGVEQFGLYELLQTGIDDMKLDDRRLLARHLEPLRDILRFRPDAIIRNGGDNLIIADLYNGATPDVLMAYADDLISFRNILLTSGLSKRFESIRQASSPNIHIRKRSLESDLRKNGPIQVVFERQAGKIYPRVVRKKELE